MNLSRILIFFFVATLSGCAGCSKSGREALKNKGSNANVAEGPQDQDRDNHAKGKAKTNIPNDDVNVKPTPAHRNLDATLSELYNEKRKGVFLVFSTDDGTSGSQGSGFFIADTGLAVSNEHVFDAYHNHYIKLYDGTVLSVTSIIKRSKEFDYVVFRVNTNGHQVQSLPRAKVWPDIGENVFAIGNPKGLEQTLSTGIISGYRESNKYIQTTAEITNGSSGGPLFNMSGEVVGITTAGYGEANLNFAINIQFVDVGTNLR